jgi:hypothetical protein
LREVCAFRGPPTLPLSLNAHDPALANSFSARGAADGKTEGGPHYRWLFADNPCGHPV